jgi:toxin HigB-1
LEIAFAKQSLRRLCENEETARRLLGKNTADKLKSRLADLLAAGAVKDLVAGRPKELPGCNISLDLSGGFRLVFCINHSVIPLLADGEHVDWAKVSRIKIISIENK